MRDQAYRAPFVGGTLLWVLVMAADGRSGRWSSDLLLSQESELPMEAPLRFMALDSVVHGEWRDRVAELFHAALPDYYDLMPLSRSARLSHLESELSAPSGELSDSVAVILGDQVVGAYAALPNVGLYRARLAEALRLQRAVPPALRPSLRTALMDFARDVPLPPNDGIYLARLATAPASRRAGIGRRMLRHLSARYPHSVISVHVRATNEPALSLYAGFGFRPANVSLTYHLLVRLPSGDTDGVPAGPCGFQSGSTTEP